MYITTDREGWTSESERVESGTRVEYLGHVPGGNVQVKLPNGHICVMLAECFAELR